MKAEFVFHFSSERKLTSRAIKAPSVQKLFNCVHFWCGLEALLFRMPLSQNTHKSIRIHRLPECKYGLLCCGWLGITHTLTHCSFFHVFSFSKSNPWALPPAAQIHTVLVFKTPIYMHLLQQEMMQRLSQGAVRTRWYSGIVPPGDHSTDNFPTGQAPIPQGLSKAGRAVCQK